MLNNATYWRLSGNVIGMVFATVPSVPIVAFPLEQLSTYKIFGTSNNNIKVQCLILLSDF